MKKLLFYIITTALAIAAIWYFKQGSAPFQNVVTQTQTPQQTETPRGTSPTATTSPSNTTPSKPTPAVIPSPTPTTTPKTTTTTPVPVVKQPAPLPPENDVIIADEHEDVRLQIIGTINNARVNAGINKLNEASKINLAAQANADDMTAKQYIDYTSPTGKKPTDWIAATGYSIKALTAHIDSFTGTPSNIVQRWQDNSSTQYNGSALSSDYDEIGVGVGTVKSTPVYVVYITLSQATNFAKDTKDLGDTSQIRNALLARVNAERSAVHVAPLKMNDKLTNAAQAHTNDMLKRAFYSHVTPDGVTPDQRITAAGYNFQAVGENIAKGQSSVKEVMDQWMKSPAHRDNILDPEYTEAGFGLSYGKNTNGYEILWAQEFGRPL